MIRAQRDLPANYLRVIGSVGVHELDARSPTRTLCGLVIAEHDFEGWAERPSRLKRCPICLAGSPT
jgi:hypothetical protein